MLRRFLFLLLLPCFIACQPHQPREVLQFHLNDSTSAWIPVTRFDNRWELQNGGEVVVLQKQSDSILSVPVFNGTIEWDSATQSGFWIDSLRPSVENIAYRVAFSLGDVPVAPSDSIAGTWDIWFEAQPGTEPSTAQLDLTSEGGAVTGTIRTPTGDYRYLHGVFTGGHLALQTFDGAHLYRIEAVQHGSAWTSGSFFSGNHYRTDWCGQPAQPWEEPAALSAFQVHPDSLVVDVIGRDGSSHQISLMPTGQEPLVVDILGSWCPNCMDEVRMLHALRLEKANQLISIAFERESSPGLAYRRLDDFKEALGVDWDVHLGGPASKTAAAAAFPFLDRVISFPTTLFIQADGMVTVHSGFNGPATGPRYAQERAAFERYMQPLTSLENH